MPQDANISGLLKAEVVQYFGILTDSEPNPAVLLTENGTLVGANRAAKHRFPQFLTGVDLGEICDDAERLRQYLRQCAGTRGPLPGVVGITSATGEHERWRCDGGVAQPAAEGAPALVIIRLRKMQEAHRGFLALTEKITALSTALHRQERTQAELENALAAKEVLLAEVQHRIKNNLQIVLSMLSFARKSVPDPKSLLILAETSNRVHAMATVHALLYESPDFTDIDCAQLIAMLAAATEKTHGRNEVKVSVDVEPFRIGSDDALSLALIVNELLSNAFKHAFPDGCSGVVAIRMRNEAGRIIVTVADDGVEFKSTGGGMGLSLVQALTQKLGGELKAFSGTEKGFSIIFPEKRAG